MKELVLMRHGLALSVQQSGTGGDAGRKLAGDGRLQAENSARHLKELGFRPGLIISSPLVRAVETADIAASLFPSARRVQEPALASPAPLSIVLKALTARAAAEPYVLVIGHQPTLGSLCGFLLDTAGLPLNTGGFAYLKLDADPGAGKAELSEFFSPEQI